MNGGNMDKGIDIRQAFLVSWQTLKREWLVLGLVWGTLALISLVTDLFSRYSSFDFLINIVNFLISVWLGIGFTKINLAVIRKKQVTYRQLFETDGLFGKMLTASIILGLIALIVVMVLLIPYIFGGLLVVFSQDGVSQGAVIWTTLYSLVFIVALLIMLIRFSFYQFFVVEEKLGGFQAIKKSWDITKNKFSSLFVLILAVVALNIAGVLALVVGLIVTIPLTALVFTAVYEQLKVETKTK
jgi:magnesium-transporting ATPase (P-type)